MILEKQINEFNKLYKELVLISNELLLYYDIDKIKSYSVYVWSKEESDDLSENLFDIEANKIIVYNDQHNIMKEAIPIIKKIQDKLKEIQDIHK